MCGQRLEMYTLATEILACCGSALSDVARGSCVPNSFVNLLRGIGTDPQQILVDPGGSWDESMQILLEMANVRPRAMTRNELLVDIMGRLPSDNVQMVLVESI